MIDKACISLTRKCQLKCKYCHFDVNMEKKHKYKDLTQEKLYVIVNNILEYAYNNKLPLFTIGIVGSGEPLIKFNLIQSLLEYIEQNDKKNLIVKSLYQILCKLFNFRIPSQIYLKQASSF